MAVSVRSKRKGRRLRPETERKIGMAVAAEPVQKSLGILRPTRSKELPASRLLESGSQESSETRVVWVIVSLALLFILTITWLIWLGFGRAL